MVGLKLNFQNMNLQNTNDSKLDLIVRAFEDGVKNVDALGLVNGKAGQAIIFYLMAKVLNEQKYADIGESLIDEIYDRSESIRTMDYAAGLAGIGWSIEWLVQKNLIAIPDTHEILESIDKVIYKYLAYSKIEDLSIDKGICGILKYLSRRITNQTSNSHRYTFLGHLECCLFLTDDVLEIIELALRGESNINLDIITVANTLRTVSNLNIAINKPTIESITNKLSIHAESLLNKFSKESSNKNIDSLLGNIYLATSYLAAARNGGLNMRESKAIEYLNFLITLLSVSNINLEEINLKMLSIFNLANFYYPNEVIMKIINRNLISDQTLRLPAKLYDGLGVAILADVCANQRDLELDISELILVL